MDILKPCCVEMGLGGGVLIFLMVLCKFLIGFSRVCFAQEHLFEKFTFKMGNQGY